MLTIKHETGGVRCVCWSVMTHIKKAQNMRLPSSAATFSSKSAIPLQTYRIGGFVPKRNIIVTGVVACRIALGEGERAQGHCMGGGRSTFDMSHYDMNVLTYQVYI